MPRVSPEEAADQDWAALAEIVRLVRRTQVVPSATVFDSVTVNRATEALGRLRKRHENLGASGGVLLTVAEIGSLDGVPSVTLTGEADAIRTLTSRWQGVVRVTPVGGA